MVVRVKASEDIAQYVPVSFAMLEDPGTSFDRREEGWGDICTYDPNCCFPTCPDLPGLAGVAGASASRLPVAAIFFGVCGHFAAEPLGPSSDKVSFLFSLGTVWFSTAVS